MDTDEVIHAVGKRKRSKARVYMKAGSGKFMVNHKTMEEYFVRPTSRLIIEQPLDLIKEKDMWDIYVNVCGGGPSGQAGATRHGIVRALVKADTEKNRAILRKEGLLTRDARKVERKKYGRRGARRSFQFSKR